MSRRVRAVLGTSASRAGQSGWDDVSRSPGAENRFPGPLALDLLAAVLTGGAPPAAALRLVGEALSAGGDPAGHRLSLLAGGLYDPVDALTAGSAPDAVLAVDPWMAVAAEELRLAVRCGLPPAALLRRAADEQRRRTAAAQRRAVQRLEVLLVVPAGVCLLPAFVLLGVVPAVLSLLRG